MSLSPDATTEYLYLAGRQPLADYIDTVKRTAIGGDTMTEGAIAEDWRAARRRIQQLEATEAGWADGPTLEPLPAGLATQAEAILRERASQEDLALFPHRWCLVELDRLVVYQNYIDLGFVEELKQGLPRNPSQEDIFRFALGQTSTAPLINIARPTERLFRFSSVSQDLRCLDIAQLDPKAIPHYHVPGHAKAVIGIFMGYGVNVLTGIHVANRLILGNGSHHSFAARARGATHVPCLVREVAQEEELGAFRIQELTRNAPLYLKAPRPSVFKDYFDPEIYKVYRARQHRRHVQVEITLEHTRLAE